MYIKIDKIKINYRVINYSPENENKPFIVFLHEGLGSIEQWFGFDELLCKNLNLPGLSYDRYGYGKSSELKEKRQNNYLYLESDFLNSILKKLKIKTPVILFGHSDGATISVIYSAIYNKNVLALISEAHHIIIEKQTIDGMNKAIEAYEKGKLRNALEKYHLSKVDSMFYAWAELSKIENIQNFSIVHELKKITAPILNIQGKNDQYGTYKQLELIEKNCINPTLCYLENCGHIPHREKTEIVIDEIKKFIIENTNIL